MELVREFDSDHLKHLKSAMDELVGSGADDGLVIFETDRDKFVQFAYKRGDGLTFDLPRMALSDEERAHLATLEAMGAMTESEISYLLQIGVDTRMGARLADQVFREVFHCPTDYKIRATVDV